MRDRHLEPVRAALLEEARSEAQLQLLDARGEADKRLSEAHRQATELLSAAESEGEEEAERAVARNEARARREARSTVLGARQSAYEELRRRARARAAEVASGPGYPRLLDRLTDVARSQLGPGVELLVDEEAPGLVAVLGGRRVDMSLDSLIERAIDALGREVEELWS